MQAGLEIATDTVANVTNIFSLATKNSGLVAKVATRFLYDLDLIKRVKLKRTFHLILLCFHHKKCAKSHKQSQFTSKFIPTSIHDICKSDGSRHTIRLRHLRYANWRLKICILRLYFSSWSPEIDLRIFLISSPGHGKIKEFTVTSQEFEFMHRKAMQNTDWMR